MSEFYLSSNTRLSGIIAVHRKARARKKKLERYMPMGWSILVRPVLWFLQTLEGRALRKIILICPADSEDAREKLIYLMAVMMADRASPGATQLTGIIETLRPHRTALVKHLKRRTTTSRE